MSIYAVADLHGRLDLYKQIKDIEINNLEELKRLLQ